MVCIRLIWLDTEGAMSGKTYGKRCTNCLRGWLRVRWILSLALYLEFQKVGSLPRHVAVIYCDGRCGIYGL